MVSSVERKVFKQSESYKRGSVLNGFTASSTGPVLV